MVAMGVVWRVAGHEVRQYARGGTFRVGAALLSVAVIIGLIAGGVHYARIEQARGAASARESARWLAQPPRDPHSASHFGQSAFHQRSPLSAIDSGVDPYVGVAVFLESHKRNFARFPWVADAARWQGVGHYTAATALRVFLPLFLILLAHDAVAGERERGTLALIAATGVRPAALVAGKALGVGLALLVVVVPLIGLGAITMVVVNRAAPAAEILPRALVFIAAYGAYSFTFVGIALAVSAWARSVSAARAILLTFWALSTLVAPRAVADLAQLRHPVPSTIEFARDFEADQEAGPRGAQLFEAFKQAVMAKYGVTSIDKLPVNFSGLWMQQGEERSQRRIDRHFGALQATYDATARFYARASWLGPALAVDAVSTAMAGSDLAHYGRFLDAAERHRRAMVRALNEDLTRHPTPSRGDGGSGERYRAGVDLWQRVGTFQPEAPSWRWALTENTSGLAAMSAWTVAGVAALVGAAVSLGRHP